jgi:hypothetical protein
MSNEAEEALHLRADIAVSLCTGYDTAGPWARTRRFGMSLGGKCLLMDRNPRQGRRAT